jgi:endonuclease-3
LQKIDQIFERLAKLEPEPKTELYYVNEYSLLVAIVLSAQATDVGVNKATPALFAIAKTAQEMIDLGLEELKSYIKTIGLYNTKASNIICLSRTLIERHQGQPPQDLLQLQSLAGVGRKTARVFLNCAHGAPLIAVDTHVFRVSNRLGIVAAQDVGGVERQLEQVVPGKWKKHAHHWLILHGRYVCVARKPKCANCILQDLCEYYHDLR